MCRACGQQLRGVVATPDEIDVRPVDDDANTTASATTSCDRVAVNATDDPVDEDTRRMARHALVGWRVRLAAVRVEKYAADDREPSDADLALLWAAIRLTRSTSTAKDSFQGS